MTKAKTIGAVERERERELYLYSTKNSSTNNVKRIKEGRNTFISVEIETG